MNIAALLALISDLYAQVNDLQRENIELKTRLAAAERLDEAF